MTTRLTGYLSSGGWENGEAIAQNDETREGFYPQEMGEMGKKPFTRGYTEILRLIVSISGGYAHAWNLRGRSAETNVE